MIFWWVVQCLSFDECSLSLCSPWMSANIYCIIYTCYIWFKIIYVFYSLLKINILFSFLQKLYSMWGKLSAMERYWIFQLANTFKCFSGVNLLAKLKYIWSNILFYPRVPLNQIYFKRKLIHLFLIYLHYTNKIATLKNYLMTMKSFEHFFIRKLKRPLNQRLIVNKA